jgi:ferredoxin
MAIDLAKCVGCEACVTACYAENNIPTVGQSEILRGRELTWIRIERYWETSEAPGHPVSARFIPMLCQQCGNETPCAHVCPQQAVDVDPATGIVGQMPERCLGCRVQPHRRVRVEHRDRADVDQVGHPAHSGVQTRSGVYDRPWRSGSARGEDHQKILEPSHFSLLYLAIPANFLDSNKSFPYSLLSCHYHVTGCSCVNER